MGSVTSKLFLLGGADLRLTQSVAIKHPTVTDVLSLNGGYYCEELYWSYVSAIMSDPYDYMVYLDDHKIDYETISAFRVFALRWNEAQEKKLISGDNTADFMREALTFFFGEHDFTIIVLEHQVFLVDASDPTWALNEQLFDMACDFIREINCLERTARIKPATKSHKRILIEDMRDEQKRKAREKKTHDPITHIADALGAVLAGGSGAITPENCSTTHIYQLLSASRAIQKKMVVQSMLNGIYTGMMKADKISNDDLSWA